MVMEPPTPQCVGREFVRQYYTLLNQAPLHLHRFYNSSSSFVHGGIDGGTEAEEVRGQQQIHEKIVQLNFRDCHAKIRKVDSHKTLADGVVVQVSGELSNNGQPMRRFVQTFVLAPQSPKKYYVHNDIFRYQDEVFTDVETESATGSVSMAEEQGRLEKPIQEQILAAAQATKPPGGQPLGGQIAPMVPQQQVPEPVKPVQEQPVLEETYTQEPHVNGVAYTTSSPPVPEQPAMDIEEESPAPWKQEPEVLTDTMDDDEPEQAVPVQAVQQQQQPAEPSAPSGPMSYRDRVLASKPPVHGQAAGAAMKEPAPYQQQQGQAPAAAGGNAPAVNAGGKNFRARETSRGRNSAGGQGQGGQVQPSGQQQNQAGQQQRPNDRYAGGREEGEGRQRMSSNAGDQYQLFVGNLPHSCTDQDLKDLFIKFGAVQDVRINNKKGSRNAPSGKPGYPVPNYGFVVFDDISSVEKAMASQPILLNGNHRLNIEEKKSREMKRGDGGGMGGKDGMDRMGGKDGMDRMGGGGGMGAPFDRSQGGRGERGSQDNLRSAGHPGGGRGGGQGGGDRGARGMGGGGRGGGRGRGDFGNRGRGGPSDSRGGFRGGGGPRN